MFSVFAFSNAKFAGNSVCDISEVTTVMIKTKDAVKTVSTL